tara:strand:- start:12 stop:1184 length:1173 start_codon:yes stop_codon:yes gene_type:complete
MQEKDIDKLVSYCRELYGDMPIPLHRPVFAGNEKQYLNECIDSNFVSSVGERVVDFEKGIAAYTGAKYAIATMNGTAALHASLVLAGVERCDEVLTQALTFVATCNAISYVGAQPVFIDVDRDTMGMSPAALEKFLDEHAERRDGQAWNKTSGNRFSACLPMHTFGLPCRIAEIAEICTNWGIALIEDAAESLGSYVGERHTGTFGQLGTLSFNGNKIITTGGGGMILTNDDSLAVSAKHKTTTAKIPHRFEFAHDELGFNYRLPNLNAALGCAQLEQLSTFLETKANLADRYEVLLDGMRIELVRARPGTRSNYWLNAIVLDSLEERDAFLAYTNDKGVMTRPIWKLMSHLPMYQHCQNDGLENSKWLEQRVVNLPSSVPDGESPVGSK